MIASFKPLVAATTLSSTSLGLTFLGEVVSGMPQALRVALVLLGLFGSTVSLVALMRIRRDAGNGENGVLSSQSPEQKDLNNELRCQIVQKSLSQSARSRTEQAL